MAGPVVSHGETGVSVPSRRNRAGDMRWCQICLSGAAEEFGGALDHSAALVGVFAGTEAGAAPPQIGFSHPHPISRYSRYRNKRTLDDEAFSIRFEKLLDRYIEAPAWRGRSLGSDSEITWNCCRDDAASSQTDKIAERKFNEARPSAELARRRTTAFLRRRRCFDLPSQPGLFRHLPPRRRRSLYLPSEPAGYGQLRTLRSVRSGDHRIRRW